MTSMKDKIQSAKDVGEMYDEEGNLRPEFEPLKATMQEKFATSLRELADFYDAHPNFPVAPQWYLNFEVEAFNTEDLNALVMEMRPCKKKSTGYNFEWKRMFGIISLKLSIYKSKVCKKVKTGKKTWIPETPPKEAVPGFYREEEKWECDDVPGNGDDENEENGVVL